MKDELIASKRRARWGETAASGLSQADADENEEPIVEEIDGQSSQIQLNEDADYCYSASGAAGKDFEYYNEYGDAVETSL